MLRAYKSEIENLVFCIYIHVVEIYYSYVQEIA